MAQMTWQMKKATLTNDPEVIPLKNGNTMVKASVMNQKYRKDGEEWVPNGEEHFNIVAFGEVGTQLAMYGSGEDLDLEGVLDQRKFVNKFKKEVTSNNFQVRKVSISEND